MDVKLPPKLKAWVNRKMESGGYEKPEDVIADAVRFAEAEERRIEKVRDRIRKELDRAARQLDRGEGSICDEALIRRVIERGRARLEAEKMKKSA